MAASGLAIIMPAYNEAGNIGRAVRDALAAVPGATVVVVNDGSRDATSALARGTGAHVIELPYNLGIGGAVQTGYKFASENGYELVARLDGDGQHDPKQLASLLAPVAAGHVDVAIGSRFIGARSEGECGLYRASLCRSIGIRLFARVVSLLTRQVLTDTTSGFQVCNGEVAAYLARDLPSDYPEVEMIAVLCRAGYRVREVPVTMREREGGRSSITPLRSAYFVAKVLLALFVGAMRWPPEREELTAPAAAERQPASASAHAPGRTAA